MGETIVLDPPVLAGTRSDLDITGFVGRDGPSWGDAAIAATMADAIIGARPVDYTIPNRVVTIPLNLLDHDGLTFDALRMQLQQLVGLWQDQGGWLARTVAGEPIYLDVIDARLHLGGSSAQAMFGLDADAVLELETLPDWYGDEIILDAIRTTTGEVYSVLRLAAATASIAGNFPRGNRCRIDLTDTSGQVQRAAFVAFRRLHYDAASTAALSYEAELFTPRDNAAAANVTQMFPVGSTNCIRSLSLAAVWTPLLDTTLVSGARSLTHAGSYRVLARVLTTAAAGSVSLRLAWDVGDMLAPTINDPWTITDVSVPFIADLGQITIERAPVGTHRWLGQIQGKGAAGGESLYVDRVWFVPIDEFAVLASASPSIQQCLTDFVARDSFNQTAGALSGKALPIGGTWSVAGDADDFNVDTTTATAKRSITSDTPTFPGGHFAFPTGTAGMTNQAASVDYMISAYNSGIMSGLLLRYVDINNWFMIWQTLGALGAIKSVARVLTFLPLNGLAAAAGIPIPAASPVNTYQRISAAVTDDGLFYGSIGPGETKLYSFTGQDAVLATGGALARGSAGFYDSNGGATAIDRFYDNFCCWVPPKDAVVFASQSAELRTEGFYRRDSTGVAYGPITNAYGNLPRLPVSGAENVPVELLAKWSRGDLASLPDTAQDAGTAQVAFRPCWLFTPDPA